MILFNPFDICRFSGPGDENDFGSNRSVDCYRRVDAILGAFQTDIHQNKGWAMLDRHGNRLLSGVGDATDSSSHCLKLVDKKLSDEEFVLYNENTIV